MTRIGLKLRGMQSPLPCNSLGHVYATVQDAIDDLEADGGGGWVYVPPGTWSEATEIADADIELFGAGWASIIDPGTSALDAVNIAANNVTVRDLQLGTTAGGGAAGLAMTTTGTHTRIINVFVNGSDNQGLDFTGSDGVVMYCYIYDPDTVGIDIGAARARIIGNYIQQSGTHGINMDGSGDNTVIRGNIINTAGDDGVYIDTNAENCVVDGNRITGWTNEAVDDDSGTSTVGDNDTT